ncbi:MAG: VWA domain-containing protein [Endomicrobiia bacterium]|nr:VWA domain-containing protein [Endomicrobiaceae bacterium]MDD5101592.1 VWA domain-containing protein [Endomicrobiaceae bacterium]
MHFATPIFFLLFPILLILMFFLYIKNKYNKKNLINFSQYDVVNGIKKSRKMKIYPLLKIINYLILIIFIIALARPQIGEKTEDVLNQGTDIVIALDISSSMEALDFEPINRLEAAKKIAVDFVKTRTHDRIGLVLFSGLAFTQSPLTNDINSVTKLLNSATTNMSSVDGTAIGSAIVTATNRLKDSEAKSKLIILITDGANNIGEVDPITAGEIAKSLGIKIYTIGAGDPEGAYYQVMDPVSGMKLVKVEEQDLDENTLTAIAEMTGGQYFRANNTKMLESIIKEIDKLEKTEIQSLNFTSYEEIFDKFVWCLLCLLLLKILLENVFLRKLT